MICPACGAPNDAANRFCDQCGKRLEPREAFAAAQSAVATQPPVAMATCPTCHAIVLPGEAFCDECGTPLESAAANLTGNHASATFAPPQPGAYREMTIEEAPPMPSPASDIPPPSQVAQAMSESTKAKGPDGVPAQSKPIRSQHPAAPEGSQQPTMNDYEMTTAEAPPSHLPALAAEQAAYEAERVRLEEEIGRQQKLIAQLEQIQADFGPKTPPAVGQGLHEAREALARAQADLEALQPPPDPAEVARLEEEIGRQQKLIARLEQIQADFGPKTPPAVGQGLHEAREALARAQGELAALMSRRKPMRAAAISEAPTEAVPAGAQESAPPSDHIATVLEEPATEMEATTEMTAVPKKLPVEAGPQAPAPEEAAPTVSSPVVAPATAPRLVIDEGGKELPLPTDKAEIVIGREDPISGIFPEIDLTPFGGEGGGVSRQHARLTRMNGQWAITDLNSTNYTRVNGAKIDPNVPVPIQDGARLQLGRVSMTFRE